MKKRGRKRRREQRKKKKNNNLTLALLYWPVLLAARPPGLSHQAVVSVQQEVDQSSETRARSVPTRRQKLPRALGRQLLLTQVHIIHTQVCCYIYTQAWEKRHEDKKTCRTQLITPLGYRWFIWMWFSPRLFNAFSQFSSWVPQEFYIHTLTLNVNREMLHRCLPPRLGGCSTPSWISSPSHAASSSGILTRTTGKLSPCQRVSVYASRQQWGLSYSFVVVLSIENERLFIPAGNCCNICAILCGVASDVRGNALSRSDWRAASSGRWWSCLTQFICGTNTHTESKTTCHWCRKHN